MYLHIGLDKLINTDNIIGIFDLDTSTVAKSTRDFLSRAEKDGKVEVYCNDLPKSYILTRDENGKETIYISQLAVSTIIKRL